MKRAWLIAVIACAVGTGCATRRQSLVCLGAGIAATAVGAAMGYSLRNDDEASSGLVYATVVLVLGGATTSVASGIGVLTIDDAPAAESDPPPVSAETYRACTERRAALQREASTMIDLEARARQLRALPDCGPAPVVSSSRSQP